MPRQTIAFLKVFFLSCFLLLNMGASAQSWRELAPGIEYQDLDAGFLTPWSHIHVFRINLKKNTLSLLSAKDLKREYASIDEYAEASNALLAINGGFFDENYQPLGLRIDNKQLKNPVKNISWWGIFYLKNQQAFLTSINHFDSKTPDFAIQSGPRLIINNKIPPLKPGRAERSALGITQDGQVILLITDNMPLSTTELAQMMKSAPLYCENALNLDGGSSSQLRARMKSFQLDVHGFSKVSDAVVVKPIQ